MTNRATDFFVSLFWLAVLFAVGMVITHSPMISAMILVALLLMGA